MKHALALIACLCIGVIQAQQYQDKFEEAVALAHKEDKPLILVFSGSDWCAPCIKLKRSVLETTEFMDYASSHFVMYNADFPRKKKNQLPLDKLNANKTLAAQYNPKGYFPLVVVLDKEKSVLGTTGFNKKASPEDYISTLNSFIR